MDKPYLKNVGAFARASAFYDVMGGCAHCTNRTDLSRDARFRSSVIDGGVVGGQWIFLDLYGDAAFDVVGHPLGIRFGNQVLSWGESLFFQRGVSYINTVALNRLRAPGSQPKEAFLPAPMVRVSTEIFPNFGIEAFYQM